VTTDAGSPSALVAAPSTRAPGRGFVALMALCIAMAALSIDVLLPAFADIREEFGLAPDSAEPSRLITAFFVGLAVGQVVYGPMSDRYGRKRLMYAGLVVYVAGALAAVFAPTFGGFVAARLVWGFGAAAPRSLALAMVRDSFEGERMARTMSHVMTTFILVPVLAPSLGTAAMALAPWRIVLWIPIVAALVLSVLLLRQPETLPVDRRRSISPRSLLAALRAVVGTKQTRAFVIALTFLFATMSSFIGGAEIFINDVFDQRDLFPFIFGIIACSLGVGNFLAGRLVTRLGLDRLLRLGAGYVAASAAGLAVLAVATEGHPPLWAFVVAVTLVLPSITGLVPICNTAAMSPLPHVAGMAAAVLGTLSTGCGALLGSVVDSAFDGSIRPFGVASFVFAAVAASAILAVVGRVPARADPTWAADEPAATD
jgi:DHA1 family bicyclomycin/chloramphenicol resistance-like MFS transporter